MRSERIHALLPWYANGTLPPDEKDQFEAHLERCARCRDELDTVETMRAQIARHGGAFFGDHPAPETLGALFGAGETPLAPAQEQEIRLHLDVCATCAEESRWIAGLEVAEGMGEEARGNQETPVGPPRDSSTYDRRTPLPHGEGRPRTPWSGPWATRIGLAAAAAALALIATVMLPGPWRGRSLGAGSVARGLLEETTRAAPHVEIALRPDQTAIVLDIPSPVRPVPAAGRVDIVGGSGQLVYSVEDLRPADPLRGLFTIVVPRSDLPPGVYVLRLRMGAPSDREPPTEYPFKVVAAPSD